MSIFKKSPFVLLISFIFLTSAKLYSENIYIHIGITIEDKPIKKELANLQGMISKLAMGNGYSLNTERLGHPLHITLAQGTVRKANIDKCEKCLAGLAPSTVQFNLTESLKGGEFEVLQRSETSPCWGVWSLEEDEQLNNLVSRVKECLAEAKVQLKTDKFHPHISLGIFNKKEGKIPANGVQSWVPEGLLKEKKKLIFNVREFSVTLSKLPSSKSKTPKTVKKAQLCPGTQGVLGNCVVM